MALDKIELITKARKEAMRYVLQNVDYDKKGGDIC